jgi:two-component system sensor histidine kinase UhpB
MRRKRRRASADDSSSARPEPARPEPGRPEPADPLARGRSRGGYVPLVYRVAGINAGLLLAAVLVTLLVLDPHKLSRVALDEAIVLAAALTLVGIGNLLVLRRVVGPLSQLTELARTVDLARPGTRMPDATADSEAGELALTFNEMLARLEAERREATGRVLAGQEAERLRVAQELHDQIGQELTAVLLGLARARSDASDPALAARIEAVQGEVRSSLESVRRIAIELRPEALDELGLVSAVAVLGERFSERSGLSISQHIDDPLPPLDPSAELVVFRVAQEALTNVARHSGSSRASLTLTHDDGELVLEVSDEGGGLAPGQPAGGGMKGMRERATLVGGTLEIGPGPGGDGRGCTVRLRLSATPPGAAARQAAVASPEASATPPGEPVTPPGAPGPNAA